LARIILRRHLLIACVIPILLCGQGNSEPAVATPVFEKMVAPVAASSTADIPCCLIVNRETGQCMEMPAGTTESRAQVEQLPINSSSNQGWQLIPVGDQWYRIENDYTGLCLEVSHGSIKRRTKIEQTKLGDGFQQHWRKIAVRLRNSPTASRLTRRELFGDAVPVAADPPWTDDIIVLDCDLCRVQRRTVLGILDVRFHQAAGSPAPFPAEAEQSG